MNHQASRGGRGHGLHEVVGRMAHARPDATALAGSGGCTTYAQLDGAAGAWADELRARGVGRGDIVPIILPRSDRLVAAALAVLRCGAAYALIDEAWPEARVDEVLRDLGAGLVIGSGRAPASRGSWTAGPLPAVSTPPPPPRPVDPSDPCCVFFTSGTTGRPKAVLAPHRGIARLFDRPGFGGFSAETVIPVAAPVPWDAFALELWAALLHGGTAVLVDEPFLSPDALRRAVTDHGARTAWLTSSLLNLVIDEDIDALAGLDLVMTGGERLSPAHIRACLRRHPGLALVNGYGPVESAVFVTTHRITEADCDRPSGIPLGRPVPRTGIHVLDGDRLCPDETPGEICVSGDGLALRYLGPDGDGDRFLDVVLGDRPTRVYRTGDLGVRDAEGLLHYRGRADRQIKVRGHRVEPAEVERQIERHLPVRSCRVVGRTGPDGSFRDLVAFCVPEAAGDPLVGASTVLRTAMVAHHVPSAVVSLAALPLTASGKLDEQQLLALLDAGPRADPAPDHGDAGDPGDAVVELVATVFGEVLGSPPAPPDASLFDLGGTSLDAGRCCARIGARTGVPVPVARLFADPTPRRLAAVIQRARPPEAPPASRADGDAPLLPMQRVFLTRALVDPDDRSGHCLLTWSLEEVDLDVLEEAIARVHGRHEPLRAEYVLDPRPSARPIDIAAPPLDRLATAPSLAAAHRAVRDELGEDLDPTVGEVWRTACAPTEDGRIVFGCVVHHVAFDGWSESVLAADLATEYDAVRAGRPCARRRPPTLVEAHRARRQILLGQDIAAALAARRAALAGVEPIRWPDPPTDPSDPTVDVVGQSVPASLVAEVSAHAASLGVTPFVVHLAAWAAGVADATGTEDLAVGLPVRQRDHPVVAEAVGCHINTVCLRLRGALLAGDDAAVRATADEVRRALVAQDVPLPELLAGAPGAGDGRPPLFQVLFAYQDNPVPRLDLAGARSTFTRQPYLGLAAELHGELWPDEAGMRLEVSYRPGRVLATTAKDLVGLYAEHLRAFTDGRSP